MLHRIASVTIRYHGESIRIQSIDITLLSWLGKTSHLKQWRFIKEQQNIDHTDGRITEELHKDTMY